MPDLTVRWLLVENVEAEPAPAFGLLRMVGMTTDGVIQVGKANADSQRGLLVNGFTPIPAGVRGQAFQDFPGMALYETSDGAPANGDEWGVLNGGWKLRTGQTGYSVIGGAQGGLVVVQPSQSADLSSTGGTVNYVGTTFNHTGTTTNYDATSTINLDGSDVNITANTTFAIDTSTTLTISGDTLVLNLATANVTTGVWTYGVATEVNFNGILVVCGTWAWCYSTEPQFTADVNDWVPASRRPVVRITADVPHNLTGIVPSSSTRPEFLTLANPGTVPITLKALDTGSASGNRLDLPADQVLDAKGLVSLWYDPADSLWRLQGSSASGGGISSITVESDTGTPSYSATKLTFPLSDFTITNPTSGEARITFTGTAVAAITVEEVDGTPSYSGISTLRIDSADGLFLTQPGAGIARLDLAAATSVSAGSVSAAAQTIGGEKSFAADTYFFLDTYSRSAHNRKILRGTGPGLAIQEGTGASSGYSTWSITTYDDTAGTTPDNTLTLKHDGLILGNGAFQIGTDVGASFTDALGNIVTGGITTTAGAGVLAASRGGTGVNASAAANGEVLIGNGSGFTLATLTAGANVTITNTAGGIQIDATGGGTGTVTSVDVSLPNATSGGAVTTSGTVALTWDSQAANTVFASPDGAAGSPTFRALVAADIPDLDASKITTGTFTTAQIPNLDAAKITTGTFAKTFISSTGTWGAAEIPSLDTSKLGTGVLGIARGGTGTGSTPTNGQLLIGNGTDYTRATLTQGTGITVTNAAGSVTIATTITQYTDEQAQDAVGAMIANSSSVNLAYVDATPSLTATVATAGITSAMLRDSAACSVIGRSPATVGAPADIAAASNGTYLQRNSGALSFAAIPAADIPNHDASKITTGLIGVARGGSGADLSATSGFLRQASSGAAFAAAVLAVADLPLFNGFTDTDIDEADVIPLYDTSAGANRDVTVERLLGFGLQSVCQGRLTLTSGSPVATADATATSVRWAPYQGNRVSLYDGTRWKLYPFTEITLALGTVTSGTNYDFFLADVSGTLTLEKVAWKNATVTMTIASPGVVTWTSHGMSAGDTIVFTTSGALPTGISANTSYYVLSTGLTSSAFRIATTYEGTAINTSGSQSGTHTGWQSGQRGTALTTQDGVYVKSGDATRRFIGTGRTSSTTQMTDTLTQRFLWNYYHRVNQGLFKSDATSHAYTTVFVWRQWNAVAGNKVEWVEGLREDGCNFAIQGSITPTGQIGYLGGCLNATNTNSFFNSQGGSADLCSSRDFTIADPSLGYNYVAAVEQSSGSTVSFGGFNLSGMIRG